MYPFKIVQMQLVQVVTPETALPAFTSGEPNSKLLDTPPPTSPRLAQQQPVLLMLAMVVLIRLAIAGIGRMRGRCLRKASGQTQAGRILLWRQLRIALLQIELKLGAARVQMLMQDSKLLHLARVNTPMQCLRQTLRTKKSRLPMPPIIQTRQPTGM